MTSKISCTRRLEFDAAHRVMQHESKCRHLHGHRYVIEATFQARVGLDALGRVIDFGVIKDVLGTWIDTHWDHTTILHEADRPLGEVIAQHTAQTIYYIPMNPTAEHMAAYLLERICPMLFAHTDVECTHIRLHETPNCYADVAHSH
jgi:6-pyruvoyltetrahydropterin/6-carboxytetrahydropterin synthase